MTKRKQSEVTVSFQVTFVLPNGFNIPRAREAIKEALRTSELALDPKNVSVYLAIKETKYG